MGQGRFWVVGERVHLFRSHRPPSRNSEKKHVLCGFMAVSWVFHGVFQASGTICGAGADLGVGEGCERVCISDGAQHLRSQIRLKAMLSSVQCCGSFEKPWFNASEAACFHASFLGPLGPLFQGARFHGWFHGLFQ